MSKSSSRELPHKALAKSMAPASPMPLSASDSTTRPHRGELSADASAFAPSLLIEQSAPIRPTIAPQRTSADEKATDTRAATNTAVKRERGREERERDENAVSW